MSSIYESLIDTMEGRGHELVLHGQDPETGLKAIIAIHSTALGPALGGTRFYPYPNDASALTDVLRLAEGMSLKSAAAGLDLGGGKAVIIGDPHQIKTPDLLHSYGTMVDSLGGRYITAEDVGTTVSDMVEIATETRWVTGLPINRGGSGDPSSMTARGVLAAMRATAGHLWDDKDLTGRRVAIQGVGKVGRALARLLLEHDVAVVVSDVDPEAVRRAQLDSQLKVVSPHEILAVECDILAPCALGAVLSSRTIRSLRCAAVVGSANNQLASEDDAQRLEDAGILYVPDFVANAGGVVNISVELTPTGYSPDEAARRVDRIGDQTSAVLQQATDEGVTPLEAAMRVARHRIMDASKVRTSSETGSG